MAVQSWVLVNPFTSQLHAERNSHCWWASVEGDYIRAKGPQLPSPRRVVILSFCHRSPSTIILVFAFLSLGFPGGSASKESACNAGDLGLIPGLERSLGKGKGYPLQYCVLENSMNCMVHGVAKSRTQLSNIQQNRIVFCIHTVSQHAVFTWQDVTDLLWVVPLPIPQAPGIFRTSSVL